MRRAIDLSVTLQEGRGEPFSPKITRSSHRRGAKLALAAKRDETSLRRTITGILGTIFAGRGIRPGDMPDGLWMAVAPIRTETHHGTHVDAPYHHGPITAGKPARTIDELPPAWFIGPGVRSRSVRDEDRNARELPPTWFIGPGVRLDMRHKAVGSTITVDDLKRALAAIDYTLRPMDIVMLWTGADRYWGQKEYSVRYCVLGREGTLWLLDQGIKVIGTDAWSLDHPPIFIARDIEQTRDPAYLWPAHLVGREREYSQIEKLAGLGDLPVATGYTVACFPTKIKGASGGWTRAVAMLDDEAP